MFVDEHQCGGVDSDGGDQPPMMLHLSLPSLQMPALDQADIVLAGFRDCTSEALRYLTDVEKIPDDDPLITGLKLHLVERQELIDYDDVLTACAHQSKDDQVEDCIADSSHSRTQDSIHRVSPHHSIDSQSVLSASPLTSDTDMMEVSDSAEIMGSVSQAIVITSGSQTSDEANSSSDEDMSQSVISLALLAQNNPAIASLTEEILSLLESDDEEQPDQDISDSEENTSIDCE